MVFSTAKQSDLKTGIKRLTKVLAIGSLLCIVGFKVNGMSQSVLFLLIGCSNFSAVPNFRTVVSQAPKI